MPDMIDKVKLKKEINAMVEMLTHPEFVAAMKNMKSTPISKRRAMAKRTLTTAKLKQKGVRIPAGMRITTRYFEPGRPDVVEVDSKGKVTITKKPGFPFGPAADAWGGCACGGAATVCGGAGGGS